MSFRQPVENLQNNSLRRLFHSTQAIAPGTTFVRNVLYFRVTTSYNNLVTVPGEDNAESISLTNDQGWQLILENIS